MNLPNQKLAVTRLEDIAKQQRRSVLIDGMPGVGKSYLAKQFSRMVGISDFQIIKPTVGDLREAIAFCYENPVPLVICVENLDTGVSSAQQTFLKFLEEPPQRVYVIVTCRNISTLPDTIKSRCAVVSISPCTQIELDIYAGEKNIDLFINRQNRKLWRSCRTLQDVDVFLKLSDEQIDYIEKGIKLDGTVYETMWMLQNFPDKAKTPLKLVLQHIMFNTKSTGVKMIAHECLRALDSKRLAPHVVLAKFLFDLRYT